MKYTLETAILAGLLGTSSPALGDTNGPDFGIRVDSCMQVLSVENTGVYSDDGFVLFEMEVKRYGEESPSWTFQHTYDRKEGDLLEILRYTVDGEVDPQAPITQVRYLGSVENVPPQCIPGEIYVNFEDTRYLG